MKNTIARDFSLTDVDDSILVIIDVQQEFLDKLDRDHSMALVNRIGWITEMAVRFEIPLVVTAEDMKNNSGTVRQVAAKLPPGVKQYDKMSYGLAGERDISAPTF